ncbi:MAG: galactose mutarotase [Ruminococcaceae bacterium]|nr:galactose mutarotase [Oscillospiraceae bacterium]
MKPSNKKENIKMSIEKITFGKTKETDEVLEYLLKRNGVTLGILNYGATIHKCLVETSKGVRDVIGGYDTVKEYEDNDGYQGALIGRVGNRICRGKFSIDGVDYTLAINNGENSLHGGLKGFDKYIWTVTENSEADCDKLIMTITSPHMDQGYPGKLKVTVTYTLNDDKSFSIGYEAESDRKTVLNLTNHSYFNLTGFEELNVLDHKLKLYCSNFTPVDHTLIPTGEIRPVKGTAFDFTEEKTVGRDIEAKDLQLEYAGGYDHNYVIDRTQEVSYRNTTLFKTAALTSPDDVLSLEVATDQPGVQVYCGNFLHDDIVFKGSKPQRRRSAICLETQHYPDTPNHPQFPSAYLDKGERFKTTTLFKFTSR